MITVKPKGKQKQKETGKALPIGFQASSAYYRPL
jgi:hypothetical protein